MPARSCVLLLALSLVLLTGFGIPVSGAAEVNTSALSQNGWFSDDTRADSTGLQPAGTNLISPTLTDDPEATASGNPAHDADILGLISFGPAPGAIPFGTHPGAVHLQIDAAPGGKAQISHRKDDGTGHAPGSVFAPGFSMSYSWMGDGASAITASVKFGIKTADFGSTGISGRTGENVWDKVLIYEPGQGNGRTSDGTWYTETIDFNNGKWWFFDRTALASIQSTPMTLADMAGALGASTLVGGGPKTAQDVYNLITAGGAHITSVQVGIGSNNPGGSVYVNEITTNFYRSGDVTTFGSLPVHNLTQLTDHPTIAAGIAAANPGDVLQVDAGTYAELVVVNKDLTIQGAGEGLTVIDGSSFTAANNVVSISGTNVNLSGFTVDGGLPHYVAWPPPRPYYGIGVSGPSVVNISNVTVKRMGKTGFNLNGANPVNLSDITSIDNGGAGIFCTDAHNVTFNNVTTSNNQWGSVGISTQGGSYPPAATSGMVFTGTNSFGEGVSGPGGYQGGLYIEDNTGGLAPISWSTNILDGADVTIQATDFTHTLDGDQDDGLPRTRFYPSLNDAVLAALQTDDTLHVIGPGHFLDTGRYIRDIATGHFKVAAGMQIQPAADAAADGDVIDVATGTFVEQVSLGVDASLLGAGVGNTVIEAPATMAPSFTTSSDKYAIVYLHDTPAATVQDLTVDGLGNGNLHYQFVGVAFRNAGGTLDNLHVTGVRDTPFSGAQHGVSIYAYNDDTVARAITVQGCLIDDIQKNAFALNASATTPMTVDVSGNTVVGAGATTVTAQNGIQVWGDLITGSITGNDVSGIAYDNTSATTKWVATSILSYYSDVDIIGNTVTGGHVGIYNIDGAGLLNDNDFTIEKVGVSAYGIIATDPPLAVPQPFDPPAEAGEAPGVLGAAGAAALLNVDISGNVLTFSGGDNTDTFGIEADGGYGPDDLALTITDNEVYGFDVGVELYQCESGCDTGAITSVVVNQNAFVGNSTAGLRSNLAFNVDATCNWWGDVGGPDAPPAHPNAFGDAVIGDVTYAPWLDGIGGNCDQYGDDYVFADTAALTCITAATPCVTVPVEFVRGDATPARGVTVDIQLSSGLTLCGAGIVQGDWLDGFGVSGLSSFQVIDNGGGSYTIDQAVLGSPCGPTGGGTLFTVSVTGAVDGTESITVTAVDARDCGDPFAIIPGIPGPAGFLTIDYTAPAALADLDAQQLRTGNDSDGNTIIDLSWTAAPEPDAATVEIYRKGFGFYPEYDDDGGAAPAAPADPSSAIGAGWTFVASVPATMSAYADEPANRDYWYYVAYVVDDCGNVGAVSNRTDGDLNYHLGDFSPLGNPGDNLVTTLDVSALGAAYGTVDGDINYADYVDIGPTSTNGTSGLPLTDSRIQFEDLIIFAINYGQVSKPAGPAADRNQLLAAFGEETGAELEVTLRLASAGNVQAASIPFSWNPEVVEPAGFAPGDFLDRSGGVAFQPDAGRIDLAALGGAFRGEGDVVTLRFRVLRDGDPGIGFGDVDARDTENRPVTLPVTLASDRPGIAVVTRLLPSAPNPFQAGTTVSFSLADPGRVRVQVYSLDGRLVRTLLDERRPAGDGRVVWDGADARGRAVASGTYLIRMDSPRGSDTQRVVRLK